MTGQPGSEARRNSSLVVFPPGDPAGFFEGMSMTKTKTEESGDDANFWADYRREQSLKTAMAAHKKDQARKVECCVESFALLTRLGVISMVEARQ